MTAYSETASALEAIINAAYASEGWVAEHDRLHESVGHERTRIGISLEEQAPQSDDYYTLETTLLVQFYGKYRLDVDPNQKVDPRVVAEYAERFMVAVRESADPVSGNLWFFNVVDIDYPNDPTGNKSRFEATVVAKANNPTLVETGG